MKLIPQKLEGWGYRVVKKFHNPNFNRFCTIHPCDGRTDAYRRTGGSI